MRGMLGSWLLASLLLWQPGVSAAPPSLQAYTENLPPLNYEQGGQPRGFSVELLKLMAAEAGLDLRVAVNLPARALLMNDLPELVERALRTWGLRAGRLMLEIEGIPLLQASARKGLAVRMASIWA